MQSVNEASQFQVISSFSDIDANCKIDPLE
jgi:hypothetical protein